MRYVTSVERIGIEKGLQQGFAQGKAKGKAEMLLRQLRRRFTLSPEIEARVLDAESAMLDDWMDRFVDAKALTDIFTDQAH